MYIILTYMKPKAQLEDDSWKYDVIPEIMDGRRPRKITITMMIV